jgi:hypothetical protein
MKPFLKVSALALLISTAYLIVGDWTNLESLAGAWEPAWEPTSFKTEPSSNNENYTIAVSNESSFTVSSSSSSSTKNMTHDQALHNGSSSVLPFASSATNMTHDGTLVVRLSGELGNQLAHLARGLGTQILAEREVGLNLNLVMKQQMTKGKLSGKGPSSKIILDRCFPYFRRYDFRVGNSQEYDRRVLQQKNWSLAATIRVAYVDRSPLLSEVRQALEQVKALSSLTQEDKPTVPGNASILVPFVETSSMNANPFLDKYYDELRQYLFFDDTACCKLLPDPDETVFVSPTS